MLQEIADAIGVSPLTVYRWERGETQPRGVHALRWADALGIEAKVS